MSYATNAVAEGLVELAQGNKVSRFRALTVAVVAGFATYKLLRSGS